ncbi:MULTISPECIES: type II toxin-antitoxin system PemK/MazF family toxin [Clostridium]|uniref:type II toxin-antitoxin system PemK/MazF family toxin n=1 Tax=Clostridium TaxID=1485 RepID=UPI000824BA69|nr:MULTISPECIES: type II toxin-antitoxin system PemK/MazF family toxin [Clostridium]PJI08299.1 type II toxin-antitoxin system PemK/MazF family toxin [Clostridium sp. CT7]
MKNTRIRDMKEYELQNYIKEIRKEIEQQLKMYVKLNNNKLSNNGQIQNLKKKAYNLKEIYEYIKWANDKIAINNNVGVSSRTIPKRGEIWTCQLGENIGSEENKIRPAIIIQNDTGNEKGPTTIIVPISNRPKKISTHIELRNSDYKLVHGEVNKITGTVLCEQIKVVSKARLGRHVATLNNDFVNKILNSKLKISIKV